MRKYLAITAVPFLLSCGGDGKELSDKVSEPKSPVAVVSTEVTASDPRDYCNGPPSISHLFNGYEGLRKSVKSGGLRDSFVKRMYDSGEREYQKARDLHATCRNSLDYLIASQRAINSINFITEALIRQEELNGHYITGEFPL